MPRFNEHGRGSGLPELESIQVSKYNCTYATFNNYLTIGDSKYESTLKRHFLAKH